MSLPCLLRRDFSDVRSWTFGQLWNMIQCAVRPAPLVCMTKSAARCRNCCYSSAVPVISDGPRWLCIRSRARHLIITFNQQTHTCLQVLVLFYCLCLWISGHLFYYSLLTFKSNYMMLYIQYARLRIEKMLIRRDISTVICGDTVRVCGFCGYFQRHYCQGLQLLRLFNTHNSAFSRLVWTSLAVLAHLCENKLLFLSKHGIYWFVSAWWARCLPATCCLLLVLWEKKKKPLFIKIKPPTCSAKPLAF